MIRTSIVWLLLSALSFGQNGAPADSVILRSMKDELERSKKVRFQGLEEPYYIEYALDDASAFSTSAALGATLGFNENRFRVPRVRVRVGDAKFDNTNYVFSDYGGSSRYDPGEAPIDDAYNVLRRGWWLATDRAYKAALEVISRKRAALKNVTQQEALPDFWPSTPVRKYLPPAKPWNSGPEWVERTKAISRVFLNYPELTSSQVNFNSTQSTFYMINTEGTIVQRPEPVNHFYAVAHAYAADGSMVHDAITVARTEPASLPSQNELQFLVRELADHVKALSKAPVGDAYSGPVLFEGMAGAQIIAELLAPQFALSRRPVPEPGRPAPLITSELENKLESRVLPEFLSVVDDPTQREWHNAPLIGTYDIDEEGVAAGPLTLIDKGRLKTFLLTRTPVRGQQGSNGRARLPGSFGGRQAAISNLFVNSSESVRGLELRQRFIKLLQDRNKPWGIVIRKMDFPSSASPDELRRLVIAAQQGGGGARPVSAPVLMYRVYPDGREELIRGLRFRGLSVRALRDIVAVSEEKFALHYLNNMLPFSMLGSTGYVALSSVIAPSILFDELELERPQDDLPKLPVVPAPELHVSISK